ncbi:MerR family transcriptional regulator [Actinopolymorpha singaporensis]|nr:MerR family transcriptional regulator [Actinopolymorpha singaporensis]
MSTSNAPEVAGAPRCLGIGDVAARTGLSVDTLRFYEREGLFVSPVRRDGSGRRVYTENDVSWLEFCLRMRASGMPLTTIREYVDLVRQGPGNEQDRLAVLHAHEQHVRAQLRELHACLDLITHKVRVYEEHLGAGTAGSLWSSAPTNR